MTVGIFTTLTDPGRRGDHYRESIACYEEFADRVVIVDGHSTWAKEFEWGVIGQHFQWGYDRCDTDWVIHMDLDFLFHENHFNKIREVLNKNPDEPAISFHKLQFILPDRYNIKSRLVLAVNKKKFGESIKFNGGGDKCQPTLFGEDLEIDKLVEAKIPFYNYEKLIKTEEQIADDVGRMDRAYFRSFGKYLYGKGDDTSALEGWFDMVINRYKKPSTSINLGEHPKYIRDTIKNLRPDQFGYNGIGRLERNSYA